VLLPLSHTCHFWILLWAGPPRANYCC
jgi:hypothetical protein